VQLDPSNAAGWRRLGNALVDIDRAQDGALCFQHALALEKLTSAGPTNVPTPDARVWDEADRNATLFFQSGRLQEAVASFTQCIELRPDRAPTLLMRALALFGLNRFDEAWEDIACAHALDP